MNARKEFDQLMSKTTLTDQEFVTLKQLVTKHQLSLARKTATFFGIAAITILITLVYGFVSNAALRKTEIMAAWQLKEREEQLAEVARVAQKRAEEFAAAYERVEAKLKECNKKK